MAATADIREEILDAANRLFAANGYDGTSLSSISESVGIRKPSLLYHFPSKDELRQAVLGRLLAHWNEVLPTILQAATTGTSRFDALVSEVVAFFTEDPDRARLLLREMLDRPEAMKELMGEHLAPWLSIISDYIKTGQKEGNVRESVDPEAYVVHVIHMIVGGLAASDVFAELIPEETREARMRRFVHETIRVARASLFVESQSVPARE